MTVSYDAMFTIRLLKPFGVLFGLEELSINAGFAVMAIALNQ
jgi:hypothetical protein